VMFWSKADRNGYMEVMLNTLVQFFQGGRPRYE
jgi:hypothetical protein